MNTDPRSDKWPERRVVLLGASNLTRGLPSMLQATQARWGVPLDFMAALGHGRSFGFKHRVLGRSLRGILHCGIWSALRERPPADTAALITDVGNDIVYGAPVNEIANWVDECLQRLLQFTNRIVVTELPVASICSVGRQKFFVARQILFPKSRLKFEDAIEKTIQLNQRLVELAEARKVTVVGHDAGWYGIDPIHVRRRFMPTAWNRFLAHWNEQDVRCDPHLSLFSRVKLRVAIPEERWLFGMHQRKKQPVIRLSSGTCVSLY